MTTVSKEQFRRVAMGAIDTLTQMFDDVWEMGCPMSMITLKRDADGEQFRVVVGIEEVDNGQDDDDR